MLQNQKLITTRKTQFSLLAYLGDRVTSFDSMFVRITDTIATRLDKLINDKPNEFEHSWITNVTPNRKQYKSYCIQPKLQFFIT